MRIKSFEELEIWKKSITLVNEVYKITTNKLQREYSLKDQIRRSSISIPSNIAEGFERNTPLEFKRFLLIAKGSCAELRTQLFIASNLNFINKEEFYFLNKKLIQLSYQIGALIRYLRTNTKKSPKSL